MVSGQLDMVAQRRQGNSAMREGCVRGNGRAEARGLILRAVGGGLADPGPGPQGPGPSARGPVALRRKAVAAAAGRAGGGGGGGEDSWSDEGEEEDSLRRTTTKTIATAVSSLIGSGVCQSRGQASSRWP
eukprot:1238604-Pyramimonas_sp.AAC.1